MKKRLQKKKRKEIEPSYQNFIYVTTGKRKKARKQIWNRKFKQATKKFRLCIDKIPTLELLNWLNQKEI